MLTKDVEGVGGGVRVARYVDVGMKGRVGFSCEER